MTDSTVSTVSTVVSALANIDKNELAEALATITTSMFATTDDNGTVTDFDIEGLKNVITLLTDTKKEYKELAEEKAKAIRAEKTATAEADGAEKAKALKEGDVIRYYKATDKKYHLALVAKQKDGAKRLAVIIADSDTENNKRYLKYSSIDFDYVATEADYATFNSAEAIA